MSPTSKYGVLPSPEKQPEHKFTGWYTALEGGDPVTADTLYTTAGDQTLYARWEEKAAIDPNKINYTAPQGSVFNEQEQPFASDISELPANDHRQGTYRNANGLET